MVCLALLNKVIAALAAFLRSVLRRRVSERRLAIQSSLLETPESPGNEMLAARAARIKHIRVAAVIVLGFRLQSGGRRGLFT